MCSSDLACVYSPRSLRDAMRIMWRLLRKDFRSDEAILYRSGRHIRLETEPRLDLQADGELVGQTPTEVEVVPHAGIFLVPSRA